MGQLSVVTNMACVVFVTNHNVLVFQVAEDYPVWTFLVLEVRGFVE